MSMTRAKTTARALLCLALPLMLPALAVAKTPDRFGHLYSFPSSGADPTSELTPGDDGMLYGTTYAMYGPGYGEIYSYNTNTKAVTILHSFQIPDGIYPYAGVTYDHKRKRLYGVTQTGGGGGKLGYLGTLYTYDLVTGKFKVLVQFNQKTNGPGNNPAQTMVIDPTGNFLYGSTEVQYVPATIFKFDLTMNKLTTVYTFTGGNDGGDMYAAKFVWDKTGTILYSTADTGGQYGYGNLFAFNTTNNTLTPLHQFNAKASGADSGWGMLTDGLSIDANGVLYGTTLYGGTSTYGTIYTYDTSKGVFTTIYNFPGGASGEGPWTGVTLDSEGNLWGGTCGGGKPRAPSGTLFEYTPSTGTLQTIHEFDAYIPNNGFCPVGKLTFYRNRMYGTTSEDTFTYGTIFEALPLK